MQVKLQYTWPTSSLLQFQQQHPRPRQIWHGTTLPEGVDDTSVPSQEPAALPWDKGYTVRAFPIASDKTNSCRWETGLDKAMPSGLIIIIIIIVKLTWMGGGKADGCVE